MNGLIDAARSAWRNVRYRIAPIFQDEKKRISLFCAILFGMIALLFFGIRSCSEAEAVEYVSAQGSVQDEAVVESKNILVYVTGEVMNPGVYSMPEGSRVNDALQMAGGPTGNANLLSINLASPVTDGMQITIPDATAANSSSSHNSQGNSSSQAQSGLVNINTASADELTSLPGIGTSTAQKIIADRAANGPFASIDELTRVSGIGEKKLESLRGLICV